MNFPSSASLNQGWMQYQKIFSKPESRELNIGREGKTMAHFIQVVRSDYDNFLNF